MYLNSRTFSATIQGSFEIVSLPHDQIAVRVGRLCHVGHSSMILDDVSFIIDNQIIEAETIWRERGVYAFPESK